MLIGDIMVRMAADMADLKAGFEQARGEVKQFSDSFDSGLAKARTALLSFVSVYTLVDQIRQTVELGSALQRLQDITGLAAEEVQKLSLVAKLNDVDAGALTKSWGKLVTQLVDVGAEGDKTRGIIKALGVDAFDPLSGKVKPAGELIGLMAAQFNAIEDPAVRAKVASEFFGKSYQDMLVIFKNWTADGQRVQETLDRIGAASGESTANADRLGDTLTLMAETTKARLLPAMGDLADLLDKARLLMLPAKEETSIFSLALSALAEVLDIVITALGAMAGALRTVAQPLAFVVNPAVAAVKALGAGEGLAAAATAAGDAFRATKPVVEVFRDQVAWLESATTKSNMATVDQVHAMLNAAEATKDNGQAALDAARKLEEEKKARDAAAAAAKRSAEELAKLKAKYDELLLADSVGLATNTIRELAELERAMPIATRNWDDYERAVGIILDKDPVLAGEQKAINALWKETADIVGKSTEAWAKELSALDDQIAKQEDANATFGLGKAALIDLTIAQLEHKIAIERSGDAYSPYAEQLEEVRQRMIRLRDATAMGEALQQQKKDLDAAAQAWNKMLDTVGQAFAGFIDDWLNNGFSAAAKNAWENFKKWALEALAQIAAKQIVVSITGALGVSGGAGANPLIPGGAGGGGGSIFDSLINAGSSLIGGFGDLAFAAADFAQLLGQGVGVVEAFSMATSAAGLTLGSIVPVVGAVVAAGTLIYNWVKSKEGGPKEGGFATTGETPGIGGVDSTGRWFTPGGSDAKMLEAVQSLDSTFNQILTALGGSGAAVFAQGFSTDPQGTAPSNVHTGVWVNGAQVFDNPNGNVGRSPEELQAELQTQSMRAILAALQASELPQVVHDYLASIDVSTATVEQIQAALAHAAELKVLVDQVSALPEEMATGLLAALGASPELDAKIAAFAKEFKAFSDAAGALQDQLDRDPKAEAMQAIAAAHATTFEKVGLARDALGEMLTTYDGSTQGTKDLTAATQAYVDAQVAALAQIAGMRDSLSTMFGDTRRMMDLALLSNDDKIQFYLNEATAAQALLANTTDPAEIDRLSRLINQDLTAAFNLMSPEEQKAQHDYLKGILDDTQTTADAQLDLAEQAVLDAGTQATTILANVQTALDAAATKQQQAANDLIQAAADLKAAAEANKQAANDSAAAASTIATSATVIGTAANTMETAANTPVTVTVNVEEVSGP